MSSLNQKRKIETYLLGESSSYVFCNSSSFTGYAEIKSTGRFSSRGGGLLNGVCARTLVRNRTSRVSVGVPSRFVPIIVSKLKVRKRKVRGKEIVFL